MAATGPGGAGCPEDGLCSLFPLCGGSGLADRAGRNLPGREYRERFLRRYELRGQTAIFKAVSEGERRFSAIAIAGGMEGAEPVDYAYPCGICRQVMQEFAGEDFVVIVVKSDSDYRVHGLRELLPYGFGGDSIR